MFNKNILHIAKDAPRSNNFSQMRLLAAVSVLFGHSWILSQGAKYSEDPISIFLIRIWGESLPAISVDVFFVVSGYLVIASYMNRSNVYDFIIARILRIFPALVVAVLFCVILVGPLVTNASLKEYISSPSTLSFLKNNLILLRGVQFDLPGVFYNNPYPVSVNGSLWTLPIELGMYITILIVGLLGIPQEKRVFNLLIMVIVLYFLQSKYSSLIITSDVRNAQLCFLFLVGSFLYINKELFKFDIGTLIVFFLITFLAHGSMFGYLLKELLFSYIVIFFALHPALRMPSFDRFGDLSYGFYIYAFPIQQLIAYSFLGISPMNMFLISLPLTGVFAFLSWRYIEKPALSFKKH